MRKLENQAATPAVIPVEQNANDPGPESEGPFAMSSTAEFVRDITLMTDGSRFSHLGPSAPETWPVETDTTCMVLPERVLADNFLDCFETHVCPLFPILHMPSFRAGYARLWEPSSEVQFKTMAEKATFHATINIVFALGCLNSPRVEPQRKVRTADSFYRRARAILPLDALDVLSLEVVQQLLLTVLHLNATRYSNRCWNTLGVAVRVAQALGLPHDTDHSSGQLKREMRKRTWYHCVMFDL